MVKLKQAVRAAPGNIQVVALNFETKKAHGAAAEKLGIKTIAVAPRAFAQAFRSPFFGMGWA